MTNTTPHHASMLRIFCGTRLGRDAKAFDSMISRILDGLNATAVEPARLERESSPGRVVRRRRVKDVSKNNGVCET
eukprot:scaffold145213_cov31-Tisochrysis_lutea.AAC.7